MMRHASHIRVLLIVAAALWAGARAPLPASPSAAAGSAAVASADETAPAAEAGSATDAPPESRETGARTTGGAMMPGCPG
ncbi:MAG: hypothetical protein HY321_02220 [Armatimonadetes bacterium]|nr:hypothetical protein [Armatimonadota bacterium]